jgi:hypothetical protein
MAINVSLCTRNLRTRIDKVCCKHSTKFWLIECLGYLIVLVMIQRSYTSSFAAIASSDCVQWITSKRVFSQSANYVGWNFFATLFSSTMWLTPKSLARWLSLLTNRTLYCLSLHSALESFGLRISRSLRLNLQSFFRRDLSSKSLLCPREQQIMFTRTELLVYKNK